MDGDFDSYVEPGHDSFDYKLLLISITPFSIELNIELS